MRISATCDHGRRRLRKVDTKSELAREALRSTLEADRWAEIFGHGARLSSQRGVGPEDVEALVDEVRAEMRAAASD